MEPIKYVGGLVIMDRAIIGIQIDELESLSDDAFLQMMEDVKWGMFIQESYYEYPGAAKDKGFKDFYFFDTRVYF